MTSVILFSSPLTLDPSPAFAVEEPHVRVAILQEVSSVRVTVLAPCRLVNLSTGTVIEERPSLKWQLIEPSNPGIKIGAREIPLSAVGVEPKEETIVRVNSRPYRGTVIFYRTAAGRLTVVNRLPLEEYLVGALTSETSPNWPLEALKAHAVVSRTMVAHRIWISRDRPFDVTADTSTHLYHGVGAERRRTRQAVGDTRGQVLAYGGELFSSTFHANCGGHTEDAAEIWQVKRDLPPLKGRPDPYCRGLRHSRWRMELPAREIEELLAEAGEDPGDLQALEVPERNRSGRARRIRIQGARGTITLTGRRLRELLGANRLRSLNFTAALSGGKASFDGFGWGHGVGFCQWGAYAQARQGRKAGEILGFYFPESERRGLRGLPGFD